MLTFKWCFGRFVIFSPDLMWALAVFVLWNRQILSPKTLKSAFESEFLNGLELWSLSLSGWHIYIWKQIPIKGSGFTVRHSKSPCCFSIPCCKLSISSPKMIQFGTWDDSIWGKTATKKKILQRETPQLGPKGGGLCISSDRGGQVKLVSVLCWRLPAWFSRKLLHSLYFKFLISKIGKYLRHIWVVKMKVIVRNLWFFK